jgi:aldehyde:ferredoxin oxidoreductase
MERSDAIEMSELYGWTGQILRVDLSAGTTTIMHTADYVPTYVGGLGIAARIAWDELRPGIGPFDPENPLFLMVGPLTGTLASGGGRVVVAGIAPQQRPSVFSRSGMGGHWGAELKYAGYDGIVVVGQVERPSYLWVHDGEAELLDAHDLWGRGTYATTTALRGRHGVRTRVVSCGPAGERGCRIACIQTETGNAAGQGGFGALMGAKRLKAVAVQGTGGVRVADPQRLIDLCLAASREGMRPPNPDRAGRGQRAVDPNARYRLKKCGFCISACQSPHFMAVPGEATSEVYTANRFCYGYDTTPRAQVESSALTSDLGLNGWEITYGIIPWLQMCRQQGLIDRVDGLEIPIPEQAIQYRRDTAPVSGEFLAALIQKIAYREGELGDALADGACYAAERLFGGRGVDLLDHIYPRHAGQTSHWNAHWGTGGYIYFPFWLVPVLQWCVDTRDPASDCTHSYSSHMLNYLPEHGPNRGPLSWETARAVCDKVYGEPDVCDPAYTYDRPETKALPAIYHHDRGMIVESLVLCDREHARVFSLESEDYGADTALMAKLFSACTGVETSEAELDDAGERVFNLLRAIDVRDHGRSRRVDEATASSLTHPAFTDGVTLDLERFGPMLDTYYALRGWNPANGWPTRARLEALGMGDVADGLAYSDKIG